MHLNILSLLTATVRHITLMYTGLVFETQKLSDLQSREIQISYI